MSPASDTTCLAAIGQQAASTPRLTSVPAALARLLALAGFAGTPAHEALAAEPTETVEVSGADVLKMVAAARHYAHRRSGNE